jgi:hypothetical protein
VNIDITKLVKGARIRLSTGEVLTIVGCYMSPDGIVVTAKQDPNSLVGRNVPLSQIEEIL